MPSIKRIKRILEIHDILSTRKLLSVAELSELFRVSPSAINRDLLTMRAMPGIEFERVPGGIALPRLSQSQAPRPLGQPIKDLDLKEAIASKAVDLARAGAMTMILTGSTCLLAARRMASSVERFHVVTPDLRIAEELSAHRGVEVFVVGGLLQPDSRCVFLLIPQGSMNAYHINTLFFSVDTIDPQTGCAIYDSALVPIVREAIRVSSKTVLLADYKKFGQQASHVVAAIEEVDVVITNRELPEEHAQGIRALGAELILA